MAETFRTGEAEGFLTGDAFPSEVFLAGGGFAAFAAALAAATRLAAALGFTWLRPLILDERRRKNICSEHK